MKFTTNAVTALAVLSTAVQAAPAPEAEPEALEKRATITTVDGTIACANGNCVVACGTPGSLNQQCHFSAAGANAKLAVFDGYQLNCWDHQCRIRCGPYVRRCRWNGWRHVTVGDTLEDLTTDLGGLLFDLLGNLGGLLGGIL